MRSFSLGLFGAAATAAAHGVHEERLEQIRIVQSTPNVTWQAGVVDRFAPHAPGASAQMNGVKGDWKKAILARVAAGEIDVVHADALGGEAIPDSFDSAQHWPNCAKVIGDIRDQSNCGCCWAFAGVEAASDRMCIATNASVMLPLSAEEVCFCANDDGCDGGMIDTPWDHIKEHGAVTGGQYHGSGPFGQGMCSDFTLPHCHHHGPQGSDPYPAEGQPGCPSARSPQCPTSCDASASSEHKDFASDKYTFTGRAITASGETAIQRMIMNGGPVETAFTVYSDFENYQSGVYQHVSGGMAGGHAVKMVGWGVDTSNGGRVKYWKIANSWNPYWGEQGYFRIIRGTNEGGVEDQVIAASPTATWGKKSAGAQSIVI